MIRFKCAIWLPMTMYAAGMASQDSPRIQIEEKVTKVQIDDDLAYSPRVTSPTYQKGGPVVLLDEAHGNPQFDKAFAKLVSSDGYQVAISKTEITFDALSKAKILVIMNPGVFVSWNWIQNPQPLFSDREAAAVRDWISNGGSLLFSSSSLKHQAGDMLLNYLGVEFMSTHIVDRGLEHARRVDQAMSGRNVFSIEKNLLVDGSIINGRSESERVTAVLFDSAGGIDKAPKNASTLIHYSDKALWLPRDALLEKQTAEAAHTLESSRKTETEPQSTPLTIGVPAPGIPVAVAFPLGKGRVIVIANSSALSSVTRKFVIRGQTQSDRVGLSEGDNEKFTLNVVHWLDGLFP
jgi:hypothetical protein